MTDPAHIYNWRRLDAQLTTSGQPTEPELAALAALGVRHVINLAPHSHAKALPDEAGSAAALGMTYRNIPVDFKHPTDADFAEFCTALATCGDAPVHIHCAANYRVSAFLYRYRRDVLGMEDGAARAEMEQIWHPDPIWAAFLAPSTP
ncbi:protein tyrosine phosphatase family protein [Acidisphaera sp. L21]|jgi:uncharacterized protein (TIGR01244 family)|uniref:protein tyrosine phosphatase family protein n=1 Tax=Acidisphaera sp. L21 TaxID=1641851 RepID=UPI00131CA39C|nr:protein tyrosine phosphatase family protein [Acidisphaera sp. L21]